MKNYFFFAGLMRSFAIITRNIIFLSCIQAFSIDHESKIDNARQTTQLILSIPETEINFNNTLGIWYQGFTCLSNDSLAEDLNLNWELRGVLTQMALATLEDKESDSFQKQVASYFLHTSEQKLSGDFLYFQGKAEEYKSGSKKFSLLNLSAKSLPDDRASEFTDELLITSPDIIYLQEVFNFETAFRFFEDLKNNYAHFFLLTNQVAEKTTFIASKYPLESIRFYPFNDGKNRFEGFFDFTVRNEECYLGHVYAFQLNKDLNPLQFENFLEKIQVDFLERLEVIPILLCGNLFDLKNPFTIPLIQEYFSIENSKNSNVIFLKPIPQLFSNRFDHNHSLISFPVSFLNILSGSLSFIQEANTYSSYATFGNDKEMDRMLESNYTLLAGGGASASVSQDSKGNSTVDLEVRGSTTTESGNTYSWSASGGVSRDEQGKSSGEVRVGIDIEW